MNSEIDRVVFTGDFLRPAPHIAAPTQDANIRWLFNLLSRQIALATGLKCEVLAWNRAGTGHSGFDLGTIAAIYNLMGEDSISIGGWARIYDSDVSADPYIVSYLRQHFARSIVIGFEMSPWLLNIIDSLGVPYIDVSVHSIRFLDDLPLAMKSNCVEVRASLANYALSDSLILTHAGLCSASRMRNSPVHLPQGCGLIVAQTPYDRSVIRNGRLLSLIDFEYQILDCVENHDLVFIKPHPLEMSKLVLDAVLTLSPKIKATEANIYGLLSSETLDAVYTISSSVGAEAAYFNKEISYFFRPSLDMANSNYVGIMDSFLAPDFWRKILGSLVPTTEPDGVCISPMSNRLRTSLGVSWGYVN